MRESTKITHDALNGDVRAEILRLGDADEPGEVLNARAVELVQSVVQHAVNTLAEFDGLGDNDVSWAQSGADKSLTFVRVRAADWIYVFRTAIVWASDGVFLTSTWLPQGLGAMKQWLDSKDQTDNAAEPKNLPN